ncbi:molecular chaperone [Chryseobacterium gleum]|uniref:fimbrial biogenesis chaperone n=1 Tax=Chryseobacterium gleum TaxID=250 RepID=UPI00103DE8FF|nr:molecular chaperone [Chryseobacterium gleum]QBJ84998.1 molecular chaperone [Chryseobacterium gleum]
MSRSYIIFLFSLFLLCTKVKAQTGVSVSPPRLYFESDAGKSTTQKVTVTNVSAKNSLDMAVSLGDWEYNGTGENKMSPANTLSTSCASWVTIKNEDTYFTLGPGERKDIDVTITPPNVLTDQLLAHTAVLYVSQMNPVNDVDNKGANIKVSIRSGIKLFHKLTAKATKKIEIQNLTLAQSKKDLTLLFENQGNIWADGKIQTELINTENGNKVSLDQIIFYTMPGNKREVNIPLPAKLSKGKYTASVMIDYGDNNNLELAELNFTYE